MAREKTFNALDDVFGEDFERDELIIEDTITEEPAKPVEKKPQRKPEPKKKTVSKPSNTKKKKGNTTQPFNINFEKKEPDAVTRTFRISAEVSDTLNSIIRNEDGTMREGAKGFLSRLVNNAVIKELVELGALSEDSLKEITPYDE